MNRYRALIKAKEYVDSLLEGAPKKGVFAQHGLTLKERIAQELAIAEWLTLGKETEEDE